MEEVAAMHKGARISAQKVRLVVDQIRGKAVSDALDFLSYSPKKAAVLVKKSAGVCNCKRRAQRWHGHR